MSIAARDFRVGETAPTLIAFTLLVTPLRLIEITGFAFRCAGIFLDWRLARGPQWAGA